MLTSIYLVMPVVRIHVSSRTHRRDNRNDFMGDHPPCAGLVLLAIISMVNVIYGSVATTVVALLCIEAVTLILLLGAQVIAELERKTDELTEEKLSGFET